MADLPHAFRDAALLELALTHASAHALHDNERLEFLGDAALDLIVAEELFRAHGDLSEGPLTELKASVVSRKTLAQAAALLDLGARAVVGPGMRGRALPLSVLANLYEAVLGAVYLDGGYAAAREFALVTLSDALARVHRRVPAANPKQALQQLAQARWGEVPSYEVLVERGSAHARAFLVAADLHGRRFPSAWGRTLKEAERWAAHEALLVLDGEGAP
jgi:ribonuclease-3